MRAFVFLSFVTLSGCYGAVVEPGHRGLVFNPRDGGLHHEVFPPGYHKVGFWGRMDDFDVTFSTSHVDVHTTSAEGYGLDLRLSIIYRPIISELYELDTEIGPNYYGEVIDPEFKSASRGVFAHHAWAEMHAKNAAIEDEVENEVRRRLAGRHIEIASVTMESVQLTPEIEASIRARYVGEQEAARNKLAQETQDARDKKAIENDAIKAKMRQEAQLREKEQERKIANEQATIDRLKAETDAAVGVTKARAEAEEAKLMASAHAEENKAERHTLTPLAVMDHAYEALGKLGGTGTSIMLGDWSKVPNFLFPQIAGFHNALGGHEASSAAPSKSISPAQTMNPFAPKAPPPLRTSAKHPRAAHPPSDV